MKKISKIDEEDEDGDDEDKKLKFISNHLKL